MFPVTLSTGWCADRQRRTDKMIMRLETKKGLKEEKYIKINDQSPSAMSRWNVGLCRHYPNANISGSCGARPTGKSKFGREKHTHTRGCYGGREQIFLCPQQLLFISRHLKKSGGKEAYLASTVNQLALIAGLKMEIKKKAKRKQRLSVSDSLRFK